MGKKIGKKLILQPLFHFLSDSVVLYVKLWNYHWNMTSPQFISYHRLLEEQYTEIATGIDDLAERIRMLGEKAPGTMEEFLAFSCLKEGKKTLGDKKMVLDLIQSHQHLVDEGNKMVQLSDHEKDFATSDLLIERIRAHDKFAWLLKSHFQRT